MGLETGVYINDLVTSNPLGSDDRATADDHLRLIKSTIKATFPNLTGGMLATQAELNKLSGCLVTTTELNLLSGKVLASTGSAIDNFPTGTLMLFQQTSAPTGWTKQTTHDNKALRIVSGAAGSGGTKTFTTVFSSARATTGVTLSAAQSGVQAHTHTTLARFTTGGSGTDAFVPAIATAGNNIPTNATTTASATASHSHTSDLAIQYVDLIIASKD